MLHNYIDPDGPSSDHYAVSPDPAQGKIHVQLHQGNDQTRLRVNPAQARHMADLLIRAAEQVEAASPAVETPDAATGRAAPR